MRESASAKKGTRCGICGSDCYPENIITCSNCKQVSEHQYCMESQDSFQRKFWQCYDCQERDNKKQEVSKRPSLTALGEEATSMPLKQLIVKEEPNETSISVPEFRNQQLDLSADISAGCCTSESRFQNSIPQMEILVTSDASLSTHFSPEIEWKGDFELLDAALHLRGEVQAYFPGKVCRKAYEASKKLPTTLKFMLLPRLKIWPKLFQVEPPDCNDIALYFFSGNDDRSKKNYMNLLDVVNFEDVGLQSFLDGIELLIFSSKELPLDRQRLNGQMYMWGVFRHLRSEKIKTLSSYHCRPSSKKSDGQIVLDGIFDSRHGTKKECEVVKISGIADEAIILPSNPTSGGTDYQPRPPTKFELKKSTKFIDCAPGFLNFGNKKLEKKDSWDRMKDIRHGSNCKQESLSGDHRPKVITPGFLKPTNAKETLGITGKISKPGLLKLTNAKETLCIEGKNSKPEKNKCRLDSSKDGILLMSQNSPRSTDDYPPGFSKPCHIKNESKKLRISGEDLVRKNERNIQLESINGKVPLPPRNNGSRRSIPPSNSSTRLSPYLAADHRKAVVSEICKPVQVGERGQVRRSSAAHIPAEHGSSWQKSNHSTDRNNPEKVACESEDKRKSKWPSW